MTKEEKSSASPAFQVPPQWHHRLFRSGSHGYHHHQNHPIVIHIITIRRGNCGMSLLVENNLESGRVRLYQILSTPVGYIVAMGFTPLLSERKTPFSLTSSQESTDTSSGASSPRASSLR
ncbi:hypothetical protein RRG08_003589 [Elysia crispata]|uniref:Uncharacterized protein n=1 Tax=Elysia crispata TaxID=231223 RepID=A0AAE1CZM8_9GAST|nr:hypothetical protein RRG08_003589 [Elysia crispata]